MVIQCEDRSAIHIMVDVYVESYYRIFSRANASCPEKGTDSILAITLTN